MVEMGTFCTRVGRGLGTRRRCGATRLRGSLAPSTGRRFGGLFLETLVVVIILVVLAQMHVD